MNSLKLRLFTVLFAALSAFLSIPFFVYAEETDREIPLFSLEEIFTSPGATGFSISTDGQSLYFLQPVGGISNLFRQNLNTSAIYQLTFETEHHITGGFLKGNTLLFLRDNFGGSNTNIFLINNDRTIENITPFPGATVSIVNMMHHAQGFDDEILIASNHEDFATFNIYRLNIFTKELEFIMPFADGLHTDLDGTIRYITQADGADTQLLHRRSNDEDFVPITAISHRDSFTPLSFDATGNYLYALTNIGRETIALARLAASTAEVDEIVFEHVDVDVSGIFGNVFTDGGIGGVIYHTDKPHRVFLSDKSQDFYTELGALLPKDEIIIINSICRDLNMAVVHTFSDVNRGRFYLYNRAEGDLRLLDDHNFAPQEYMAPMQPISYEARDGLTITGYLTLPVGMAAQNLPVIVMPHGGPWLRDYWGDHFNTVQFLANRGYAVFMPNFRGSTGFGRSFLEAGYGQWGLAKQDDITDGIKWLVDEGIADPTRVGIFGASYGGYAALSGITFTPHLFAAAVSFAGVSNIFTRIETIPPELEGQRHLLYDRVGHPERDFDRLMATSPIFHAENITTPLFIAHGANDESVPLSEATQFVDALSQRGADIHYMIFDDEGHDLVFEHNQLAFFAMVEAFFAEHLGGRTTSTLAELTRFNNSFAGVEYTAIDDEFWGIVNVPLVNVPFNTNGFQGQAMRQINILPHHVGEYIVIFDEFTENMTDINVAIIINRVVADAFMSLHPGDGFIFTIADEHVGKEMLVVMSTNSASNGTARISTIKTE